MNLMIKILACSFVSVLMVCTAAEAADLTENDLNRIIFLKEQSVSPADDIFFVFTGYDEKYNILCEPLSGAKKPCVFKKSRVAPTEYYKDTRVYEIALDAYFFFAGGQNGNFLRNAGLLKLLNAQHLVEPLLISFRLENELFQKAKEIRREFISRKNKQPKSSQKQKRWAFCGQSWRSSVREDKKEILMDYLDQESPRLNELADAVNKEISDQLVKGNFLPAAAIYLSMTAFYKDVLRSILYLSWEGKNLFEQKDRELMETIHLGSKALRERLKDCYANQALTKQFVAKFPGSRGLWRESPPITDEDLSNFFRKFYRIRKESQQYSPVTDLEQWGNCRLSLLLCTGSVPEAKYLEDEFLKELRRVSSPVK